MSYDPKSGKVDWRDEAGWMLISLISAVVMTLMFLYFDRFPNQNTLFIFLAACVGFYLIGIVARIQNYRGILLTGKTAFDEKLLKVAFPILGFVFGFALILVK